MVSLAQLFRHKSVSPEGRDPARQHAGADGGSTVRGLGAIAAAVGVRRQDGMPEEFVLSIGELMTRVPEKFVWLGRHDERRVVRIAAVDIAPGLARGRAEISLARLVALVPDVFRWERGETDDPQIRLPIQKLLQQIGSYAAGLPAQPAEVPPMREKRTPEVTARVLTPDPAPPGDIVAAHLPSIEWAEMGEIAVLPVVEVCLTSEPVAPVAEQQQRAPEVQRAAEPQAAAPAVQPEPPEFPKEHPRISVTVNEPASQPVELRPRKDVSTSTTLRAVVLGGAGPPATANEASAAGIILAPRAAPVVGAAPPASVIPGPPGASPSVAHASHDAPASPSRAAEPDFAGLQNLFMTASALDLAGVATLAAALPGVRACVISGAAGIATGGDFSHGVTPADVRAAAEELAHRGVVAGDTLRWGESDIALFAHGGVRVAAVLAPGGFVPGVRERLMRVAELLAGPAPAR
jgi:hypothetical protein